MELAPVFIVAPPRAGARLLASVLSQAAGLHFRDDSAPDSVALVPALHPSARGWDSDRMDAGTLASAPAEALTQLAGEMRHNARDRDDVTAAADAPVRVLEASARHAMRVPFLAAAFPAARFVCLLRHAGPSVSSLVEAWRSGRFVPYPRLPDWRGPAWSYPLVAGWRDLADRAPHEIAAVQWQSITDLLLDDLAALDADRWTPVTHDRLLADPQGEAERLCDWLGVTWDRSLRPPLPVTLTTLSPPRADKWRERDAVTRVLPSVQPTAARVAAAIGNDVEAAPPPVPAASVPAAGAVPPPADAMPEAGFGSESTESFPRLLRELKASLLVSTYQSGRVILARAEPDGGLNTHFRALPMPMGMAVAGNRIAIGTKRRVVTYLDHPMLAAKLAPAGQHDGCFLPLSSHVTGDIRIHDLAWAADELWAVSTRFSALVTVGGPRSFTPRWKPSFVSALTAEDRCHLNGCAVIEDKVRFVTALGMTDTPGGWRDDKARGGVVIDVDSNEVVAHGLSMPHSPRWYDGNLWVLESGKGQIGVVDLMTGRVQVVAELPGFTRGLTFAGPYALVGLSQVRESVFRGLPIAATQARDCGVWVVDIRNGATVAFVRFTGSVTEIFDVQLLPGYTWPELAEVETPLSDDAFVLV